MKNIKDFMSFLLESEISKDIILWKEASFNSSSEKKVRDIAEESLLTKDLVLVYEGTSAFIKLFQIASTEECEKLLEITGQKLCLFETPFEFIKWEIVGSSSETIETTFILSEINFSKLK